MPTKIKPVSRKSRWHYLKQPKILIPLVLLGCTLVGLTITAIAPPQTLSATTFDVQGFAPLNAISADETVVQTFVSPEDCESFGLYYADYGNLVTGGSLEITISTSDQSSSFSYPVRELLNDTVFYIDHPLIADASYDLSITLVDSDLPITFFSTTAAPDTAILSREDDVDSDRDLIIYFATSQTDFYVFWNYFMVIALLLSFIALTINKEFYEK